MFSGLALARPSIGASAALMDKCSPATTRPIPLVICRPPSAPLGRVPGRRPRRPTTRMVVCAPATRNARVIAGEQPHAPSSHAGRLSLINKDRLIMQGCVLSRDYLWFRLNEDGFPAVRV